MQLLSKCIRFCNGFPRKTMKTTISLLVTLQLLAFAMAHAQSAPPQGCFMHGPNQKSAYFHAEASHFFLKISFYPPDSNISGEFICFSGDRMDMMTNYSSYDPLENVYLGGGAWDKHPISFLSMARGIQLFVADKSCRWTQYYEIHADTLWIRPLSAGVLPIDFRKKSASPTDTLGLHVLLPQIACFAAQCPELKAIKVQIEDGETMDESRRAKQLKAKRLAVLDEALKRGLGDTYPAVLIEYAPASSNRARYTVSYAFE